MKAVEASGQLLDRQELFWVLKADSEGCWLKALILQGTNGLRCSLWQRGKEGEEHVQVPGVYMARNQYIRYNLS